METSITEHQDRIRLFVSRNHIEGKAHITGGVSDGAIEDLEKALNVILPDSFRWYLRTYGSLSMYGIEILGIGIGSSRTNNRGYDRIVSTTLSKRRLGMPGCLVVIENCDEYVNCIETSDSEAEDCRVVQWGYDDIKSGNSLVARDSSFYSFIYRKLSEAREDTE